MVTLNKIYTRTGDKGTTALATGERVSKHALRIEAYGTIDETNSVIGMARLHTKDMARLDTILSTIQNDLFDLGADLATPDKTKAELGYEPLRIIASQVTRLENEIDELNGTLEPLRSFVLPAGEPAAAHLHLARTICRRAERLMVALNNEREGAVSEAALSYVNRLSDLLFVAARFVNAQGEGDVLWVPGKNR
jgi:cob(I)alamin adenosyltransferase